MDILKKGFVSSIAIAMVLVMVDAVSLFAGQLGGQVFFRGGFTNLSEDRGHELFTDTYPISITPSNNENGDWYVGAGLDIPLTKLGQGSLLGEVMVEYAQFSNKRVVSAVGTVATGSTLYAETQVSELNVVIAPKYRFEQFGSIRPWIIPLGLAFMVNSPPSSTTTYLDIGTHHAIGVEYVVNPLVSIGIDVRYNNALGFTGGAIEGTTLSDTETDYLTYGFYVGVNF